MTQRPVSGSSVFAMRTPALLTILTWTFEGSCDVMTDKFLEDQAFIGDNRQERCDYF